MGFAQRLQRRLGKVVMWLVLFVWVGFVLGGGGKDDVRRGLGKVDGVMWMFGERVLEGWFVRRDGVDGLLGRVCRALDGFVGLDFDVQEGL